MILMAHMARLTQANEVAARIRRFGCIEKPERLDVMDRKAFADVATAFGALSILIRYDSRPRQKPAAPAICPRTTNPIGGIFSARSRRISAGGRAKARNSILFHKPRFLLEGRAAMSAGQRKAILPSDMSRSTHVFGPECIGGALARAKLVADQMRLWCCVKELSSLPSRSAGCAAKACPSRSVRLNTECRLADFAGLFDHAEIISQTSKMGKRTTLIACRRVEEACRQPDFFVRPPAPAPEQAKLWSEE